MRKSLRRALIATAFAAVAVAVPASPAAAQASTTCPATFRVLHNDNIGQVSLPKGNYRVAVRGGLSCPGSTSLFAQFLQDWDGVLPRPWRMTSSRAGQATFMRGNSGYGFSVRRIGKSKGGGGGRHPGYGRLCPGTFRVLHNDRIGRLRLPMGEYDITVLAINKPPCARASKLFARFLQRPDGRLPRPWGLDAETGTFRRGYGNFGFQVKPAFDD